ncbi:hypothetical protein C4564_05355 [Candidatus Microgenomates bacterium]|nr:MAG: hypothetical protein C4564_05355 [Candidatus Microgenomates bacterium]
MIGKKEKQKEIKELGGFETLTRAYSQIASAHMKRTRGSVLLNRQFLAAINDVFEDVRASYAEEILKLANRRKHKESVTFLSHNGKTVAVFLAANTGLFGDIIQRTFNIFVKDISTSNMEAVVVGRLGKAMYLNALPDRPYTYFELSDDNISADELTQLIRHVVQYEEIRVYHAQFKTAILQTPTIYTISAETPMSELRVKADRQAPYIFEPNLEKILVFFEEEIFASLMEQTVRESQLAKYASRILAMDKASENIKKKVRLLSLEKLRLSHAEADRKQLHALSGMSLWN